MRIEYVNNFLDLRGKVGVDVPQPSNAPAKGPLSRWPAFAAHHDRLVVGIAEGKKDRAPAGLEHSSPPPGLGEGGGGGNVDRKSFKSLMPPAGRDCAPSPLSLEETKSVSRETKSFFC